jgi:outer membrane protein
MIYGTGVASAQPAEEGTHAAETFNKREYSLLDLYTIAIERSEKVKISEEDLFIAEKDKDRARSAFLPTISAYGDYRRYTDEKISSTPYGSFPIQSKWAAFWGVRLDETLSLSGREFTAYNISKMGIETSRHDLYAVMEDYLLTVSEAFYDVLKANKAVEITTANVERLTTHRDAAQTRYRVGEVTKTAVLRAEAELSGAQAKLVEAQNLFDLTKAVLARVVGIEGDFTLKETALKRQEALELRLLQQEAFAERAEIKASTIHKQMAEDEVRYTKGAYWPTLSLEGVYEKRDEDPSSPFFLDESIYGGLRINFPFYEGGLRKAEVRQAEARHKQAELMYEDLKKTIGIEVENAYLDLQTQEGILESLQDQVTFAQDNYNTVSKQFDYGLANSIDVMDANTLLVEAERDFFRAQYNYQLSMIMLKRATGTLLKTVMDLEAGEKE